MFSFSDQFCQRSFGDHREHPTEGIKWRIGRNSWERGVPSGRWDVGKASR